MKKVIVLLTLALISTSVGAQRKIEYKVISDNPKLVPNNFAYLYYFDYIGRASNAEKRHRGVRGLGASINVFQHLSEASAIELGFRLNYSDLRSEYIQYPVKIETAFHNRFASKERQKPVRINVRAFKTVVEEVDVYGNFRGFRDAIGVEQIEVMGTEGITRYARGGLLFQNGSYLRNAPKESGSYTTGAFFVGFAQESRISVTAQLLNRTSTSAQYMRTYFDLMVFPVATTSVENVGKRSIVGFRVGGLGHFPGMKNFMNAMAPKVEIGMNALDGWYWQVGLGFNVYKSY